MQNFKDTPTGNIYAFDDDVVVIEGANGCTFTDATGIRLNVPTTLQPYTPQAVDPMAAARATQSAAITAACAASIVGGFISNALGTPHKYPAQMTDQQNLAASVLASLMPGLAAGWTTPFWCADASGNWSLAPHTAAQIQQVGQDGKTAILTAIQKKESLTSQINNAATVAAVQAVVW